MASKLLLKSPSSIVFPLAAKRPSLPNVFGSLEKPKPWKGEEKQCGLSLRLQRPNQQIPKLEDVNNVRNNFVQKNRNVLANAAQEGESTAVPNNLWDSFLRHVEVFLRFGRLRIMLSTALGAASISLLTIEKLSELSPSFITGLLPVIVSAVAMIIYVSGINHLCDIEIDKVNKPEFPTASGEYSFQTATLLVVAIAALGLSIPIFLGSWPLFWAQLILSFGLGFAYSVDLPLMRWKRYPLMVATYMFFNRSGTQLAYYWHMQTQVLGKPAIFSKSLIFGVSVTTFMMVVFGVFKDISDVAGDKLDGVQSFAIRFGEKKVFNVCVTLLQMMYFAAMLFGATLSNPWSRLLTVGGHAATALVLSKRIESFDHSGPEAYKSFYDFLWTLLSVEYILVLFAR